MNPYFQTNRGKLYHGDCLEVMRTLPDNSFDTMITDPPYGLNFMGKKWDYDVPSVKIWKECLRVLKPGAHALIFAGSRTQHRMAVNVEDAGFIIKDVIMWIYGQGWGKSTDISKQLDKMAGKEREVLYIDDTYKGSKANKNTFAQDKWTQENFKREINITAPATPEAELWDGWGTALKPAYEPILVAMKPNDGTYAQNALKHGVAGLNIDGGRIPVDPNDPNHRHNVSRSNEGKNSIFGIGGRDGDGLSPKGRWPANIILDEESAALLDKQSGFSKSRKSRKSNKNSIWGRGIRSNTQKEVRGHKDSGGASRFFYCAKSSKSERNAGCDVVQYELKKDTPDYIKQEIKQLLSV